MTRKPPLEVGGARDLGAGLEQVAGELGVVELPQGREVALGHDQDVRGSQQAQVVEDEYVLGFERAPRRRFARD